MENEPNFIVRNTMYLSADLEAIGEVYDYTNPYKAIEPPTKESYQGHAGPHKYKLKETFKQGNKLIQVWECRCGHRL